MNLFDNVRQTKEVIVQQEPEARDKDMAIKRLVESDGTFNVLNRGLRQIKLTDLYHSLISLSFKRFIFLAALCFIGINAIFATAFFFCGPESFDGIDSRNQFPFWVDCFFFSVQTFATIGYGHISPLGYMANILVSIEAFTELMFVALATGLLFTRFSKPTSRLLYSQQAIIGPIDGDDFFHFRVANSRFNQLVDAEVRMVFLKEETTKIGQTFYTPYDLKLEMSRLMILALSFTICHPIDQDSPFYKLNSDQVQKLKGEVLISIVGTDSTIGQTVHSHHSYRMGDIVYNAAFKDILEFYDDGSVGIDLDNLSSISSLS